MYHKVKGQAKPPCKSVLWGIISACTVMGAGALLIGKLLDNGTLEMDDVGYAVMGILFLCGIISGGIPAYKNSGNKLTAGVAGSVGFLVILFLVNALLFGGEYPGLWPCLLTIASGSAAVQVMAGKGRGRKPSARYKIPK